MDIKVNAHSCLAFISVFQVCVQNQLFLLANLPLYTVSHCDWTVKTVPCSVLGNGLL